MSAMPILMVVAGLALFFLAPKLVGFVIKVLGLALMALGAALYLFSAVLLPSLGAPWIKLVAVLPILAGLGMIFVAQGMVKLAVRIAGILLVIAGLSGMGVV